MFFTNYVEKKAFGNNKSELEAADNEIRSDKELQPTVQPENHLWNERTFLKRTM